MFPMVELEIQNLCREKEQVLYRYVVTANMALLDASISFLDFIVSDVF